MILGAGFHIIFQSSSEVVCTNGYDYEICNMMLLRCINFTANIYLFKVNNKNTRKEWNMFKVQMKGKSLLLILNTF